MTGHAQAIPTDFVLPDLAAVRAEASTVDTRAVLALGPGEEPEASRPAVALALWLDRSIHTDELKRAAEARCADRRPRLHTFVPLYTTNYCDSECKMCSMRKGNLRLDRKFSGRNEIIEQLRILYEHEGVRGVGFLTGEYEDKYVRLSTAFRIGWAMRTALDMGFERIYFNIGSMEPDEIDVLGEWIDRKEPITMCVFQETYDRESYRRFMGKTSTGVPKADYDRRVVSFDRWLDAGYRYVNPGVLVGLHDDVASELVRLVAHGAHLRSRGAVVDLSLPRMRPAMSSRDSTRIGDDDYLRMMSAIAFTCPEQRLVLTTREPQEFQDQALGLCGVISPGSPDVAPYRAEAQARNDERSSQFQIADRRRPKHILSRIESTGTKVSHFVNPVANGDLVAAAKAAVPARREVTAPAGAAPDDRPLVYFLHGLLGTAYAHFGLQIKTWADQFRMVPVDLPGHGKCRLDAADDYLDRALDYLVALVERFGPGRLVAASYLGGPLAVRCAAQHPELVTSLVLTGFAPGLDRAVFLGWLAGFDRLAAEHDELAREYDRLHTPRWRSTLAAYCDHAERAYEEKVRVGPDSIGALSVDTLIVNGSVKSAERLAAQQAGRYGPRVRGTVLEGAGHIAGRDAPDEFASAVEAFWADGDHR